MLLPKDLPEYYSDKSIQTTLLQLATSHYSTIQPINYSTFPYVCAMSIRVFQLLKTYGEQKAVNNISFEIGKGEIVGFLGPNGAGKSTTMKIITGYLEADSGSAEVCGLDVRQQPL